MINTIPIIEMISVEKAREQSAKKYQQLVEEAYIFCCNKINAEINNTSNNTGKCTARIYFYYTCKPLSLIAENDVRDILSIIGNDLLNKGYMFMIKEEDTIYTEKAYKGMTTVLSQSPTMILDINWNDQWK